MSGDVRVGIIGSSLISEFLHIPSVKSHPKAGVVAICGRRRERAEETAARHGIPRVFTDYREMIEQGDLHAIVVATPDDLHYRMTMDALEAGLHVICEKPLASNATQAREMLELADARGLKHMAFLTYRWAPNYRHLKALLDQGQIGRILHANIRYFGGFGARPDYRWTYDPKRATGTLGNLGVHMIDLARWLMSDIASVAANLSSMVDRLAPDGQPMESSNDVASLLLDFKSGAQAVIHASAVAHVGERGQEQVVLLHGDEGALEATFCWGTGMSLRGQARDESRFEPIRIPEALLEGIDQTQSLAEQFQDLVMAQPVADRAFIDAILGDRAVSPSFHDGYKAQQVVDAALVSDAEGRRVAIGA
jgi:predicted dehydrogenase